MNKRVIIVHGWSGHPTEGWFPWLKKKLEEKGFIVQIPAIPDTDNPKIGPWVKKLSETVGTPEKDLIMVGHSIGCQTISRYLEQANTKVKGLVLVAPWLTLNLTEDEEKEIAEPWLNTPIDFGKVKKSTGNIIAIFSDNDPVVPSDNIQLFKEKLGAKIIIEKNKGHFSDDDGVTELPVVLEEILRFI